MGHDTIGRVTVRSALGEGAGMYIMPVTDHPDVRKSDLPVVVWQNQQTLDAVCDVGVQRFAIGHCGPFHRSVPARSTSPNVVPVIVILDHSRYGGLLDGRCQVVDGARNREKSFDDVARLAIAVRLVGSRGAASDVIPRGR
jgi:hypothetical protein